VLDKTGLTGKYTFTPEFAHPFWSFRTQDAVTDQVRDLERNVSVGDRARLDQYFTSVREPEGSLQASKGWERKPKPVVKEPEPQGPTNPAQ
jgi:hypothetical protein